jgi:hypothetical protein
LAAVNEGFNTLAEKLSVPAAELRSSSSTSDGELTRVGTCDVEKVGGPLVRPTFESAGKT